MLIGVTGTLASGKDTVSDYLENCGFFHFSLADAIREECDKRELPKDRDTLISLGNELRKNFGADVLAKRALTAIKRNSAANAVITSIRNPKEASLLKNEPNFLLIAVDAPIKIRYQRILFRRRESDFVDFDTFKRQEEAEMAGEDFKQNLKAVMDMADRKIINDGTIEQLHANIDAVFKPLR